MGSIPARAAACVAALLAAACEGAPRARHEAIVGGEGDFLPPLYTSVVRVENVTTMRRCSGTIVQTDGGGHAWVLTAASCLADLDDAFALGPRTEDVHVFVGEDAMTATELATTAIHVHPLFARDRVVIPESRHPSPVITVHDLAIVEVDGLDRTVRELPFLLLPEDLLGEGDRAIAVGWGVEAPGAATASDVRFFADVRLLAGRASANEGAEVLVVDERGLAGPCLGDEGGPLVVMTARGQQIAGVCTSIVGPPCADVAAYARISEELDAFVEPALEGSPPAAVSCLACTATSARAACEPILAPRAMSIAAFRRCLTMQTFARCRELEETGAQVYDDLRACIASTCGACTPVDAARLECALSLDAGAACDACIASSCCAETSACARDMVCDPCLADRDADEERCAESGRYRAVRACLDERCRDTCGALIAPLGPRPAEPDAGPPDAGPIDAALDAGPTVAGAACGCHATRSSASLVSLALIAAIALRRRR